MKQEYNKNRHSCYSLKYHLVVVTKYRNEVINKEVFERLKEITINIFESSFNCKITNVNAEKDHVHILFEAPPQVQLSKLINNFKTVSSRLIRKEFKEHVDRYYWKPYFWSSSYLILSVSDVSESIINEYIENQATLKE